ncbi:hypothetical protein ACSYAD_29875 [Acaryochloris marina NIES-2412]|uniref:hypothetical protein n=1 Tax=Acaryochloris marina TaxID=155978 RepID=UPI004057E1BE
MATASFDKSFTVSDEKIAEQFRSDLNAKHDVRVERRDMDKDKEQGIAILSRFLSA